MGLPRVSFEGILKILIWGTVFLYAISLFFNFSAIGSTNPADYFNAPQNDFVQSIFKAIIVGLALTLAAVVIGDFQGGFNKKKLITYVVVGVALFFLYTKVLVPVLGSFEIVLPNLEFAAKALQSMVMP